MIEVYEEQEGAFCRHEVSHVLYQENPQNVNTELSNLV